MYLMEKARPLEALELLDEAVEMGLVPNVVTYNTLLNGYFKEGRPLEGIGLLNKIKMRNCVPDYISYSTLLHGLLKWSKIHSALGIYKEMVYVGFQVEERMMNTLLRGLCRRSRTDRELLSNAYEVFDRMKTGGYVIYPCAYELAIEAFCMGKQIDKALATICVPDRHNILIYECNRQGIYMCSCTHSKEVLFHRGNLEIVS